MIAAAGVPIRLGVNGKFSHHPLQWWVGRVMRDRITPVTPEGEPFRWQEEGEVELVRLVAGTTWPVGDICIGVDTPLVSLAGTRVSAGELKEGDTIRRIEGWGGEFRVSSTKRFVGRAYKINDCLGTIGYLEVYGEAAAVERMDSAPAEVAGTQVAGATVHTPVFGKSAGTQKPKRGGKSKNSGGVRGNGGGIAESLLPDTVVERREQGDIYV